VKIVKLKKKIQLERAESEKQRTKLLKNLKKKEKQQEKKEKEMEQKIAQIEKESERKFKENINEREQMHQRSVNELRNYFENQNQEDKEELTQALEKQNKEELEKLSFELKKKHRGNLIEKLQKLETTKQNEKEAFEEAYRWALNSEAIVKRSIIFELLYKHKPDTLDIVNSMLEEELNELILAQPMQTMKDAKQNLVIMHQNYICPPPSQRLFPNFNESAYNVIVIGPSGAGKSTFLQNLHDSIEKYDVAATIKTDVVECTKKPNRYELKEYGITIWDIPGYGTTNFELGEYGFLYIQKFGLLWFDKIIILTSERVHSFESTIPMQLIPNNIISVVARSKVNVDIRDRKTMLWKEQVREKVPRKQRKIWDATHEEKFLRGLKKDLRKSAPGANEYFLIGHFDAFDEAEVEFEDAVEFVLKKEQKIRKNSINIFSYPQNWDEYAYMISNGTAENDVRTKMRGDGLKGKRIEECMKNLLIINKSKTLATTGQEGEALASSIGDSETKDPTFDDKNQECQILGGNVPMPEQCITPNRP